MEGGKQTEILNAVRRVVELVGGDRSLAEALKLLKKAPATAEGWSGLGRRLRRNTRPTGSVLGKSARKFRRQQPLSNRLLLSAAEHAEGSTVRRSSTDAAIHKGTSAGNGLWRRGRRRNLMEVSRFLKFAVQKCGGNRQWLPVEGEDLRDLIGVRTEPKEATVPVKPEQLLGLLESLEGKPELRLAVALVGLFGLRPGELLAIEARDGDLFVGDIKRNRYSAAKPKEQRLAMPLDLKELPGEGARVVAQLESGLVQLPTSIRNAKDFKACGHAFGQYLRRHATGNTCWPRQKG